MSISLESPAKRPDGWPGEGSAAPRPQHAPQGRVIQNLKQWMKEGVLTDGSPLPSERVLSEQFQVNRGTVRRALQILQDEGLLRTQNGRTRIVTRQNTRAGALRNTVALITPIFQDKAAEEVHRGRREYIGRGTLQGIQQMGKHAMSLNPECLTREEVAELISEQPYGVVITDISHGASREGEIAGWFREGGLAVAVYGDSPVSSHFDRVLSDQAAGNALLTEFLIKHGARRILNFWSADPEVYWNQARLRGYRKVMEAASLEALPVASMPPFPLAHGRQELFEQGVRQTVGHLVEHLVGPGAVDALMVSTDSDYFGVAAACRLCGREPQKDILLVGYDDYWYHDEKRRFEPTVPLATIDKRNETMGQELVNLLEDRVEGRLAEGPERRIVMPHLIPSESWTGY